MEQWRAVPIIMVTAFVSKQALAKCLHMGADDFISKPVNSIELNARISSMLRIYRQYQELKTFNTQLEILVQERTNKLERMLIEDDLTHLPSRAYLLGKLSTALESEGSYLAIVYLDCDQFKLINGAFGYPIGNQLLQAIAQRLQHYLRPGDILARVGGDEFCVLLYDIQDLVPLDIWIQSVIRGFDTPLEVGNYKIFLSACMGIALGSSSDSQPEALLQAADTAMYKAKLRGKGCYEIFHPQFYLATLHRLTLETDLQRALEERQFFTHYQPIVSLDTQQLVGFEALVRWQHPTRGIVFPGEFIACIEETGLVIQVGMVILRQACQQLYTWQQQGWHQLTMSVNLSVRQFTSPTLLTDIDQILAETQVNPACLKLEITESAIMQNAEIAIALTQQLRSRQIQISIDDFGTGYSSLGYLNRFPLNILKIDRSFISETPNVNRKYRVVETIINLSHQLDLAVVAEGIETQQQLEWLQQLGCEFGQGYLFSRPLAPDQIEKIFLQGRG
jgi:diguanylate cyclase (GGDEF)-like protein